MEHIDVTSSSDQLTAEYDPSLDLILPAVTNPSQVSTSFCDLLYY